MTKKRITLLLVIFLSVIVISLYGTFALINNQMTENANTDYTFIIGKTTDEQISVSSNSTKTFDIYVTNPYGGTLNYGLVYSVEENYDIRIGVLNTSTAKAQDSIKEKESKKISLIIDNSTDNDIIVNISLITGYINGGDLILPEGMQFINKTMDITDILDTNLDTSGANTPTLTNGMIPIYFDDQDNSWHKADATNSNNDYEWYNYENKKWANVALVTTNSLSENQDLQVGDIIAEKDIVAYLVWIPRFKYQVWDITQEEDETKFAYNALQDGINITFEAETSTTGTITCTSAGLCTGENGEYYTHPAFQYNGKELTGFWIGKFETTGTLDAPTILPNYSALTFVDVIDAFQSSLLLTTTDNYNLKDSNLESHIVKDLEWSAVSYLTNSTYGICNGTKNGCRNVYLNNSTYYNTGASAGTTKSPKDFGTYSYLGEELDEYGIVTETIDREMVSSTTGNVYGVYDLAGGAQETVMLCSNQESQTLRQIDTKYYNIMTSKPLLGQLPYSLEITDITVEEIWLTRGGTSTTENATLFTTTFYDGNSLSDTSFRITIT